MWWVIIWWVFAIGLKIIVLIALGSATNESLQLPFASKMDRGQLHGSLSVRSARVRAVLGARVALAPTCGVGMDLN